ncbi:hypothetical protein BLOT_011044 [Blomia tropicalis]|nr:hypothetical protein BLOT_011044 [Blomia tropicalis]
MRNVIPCCDNVVADAGSVPVTRSDGSGRHTIVIPSGRRKASCRSRIAASILVAHYSNCRSFNVRTRVIFLASSSNMSIVRRWVITNIAFKPAFNAARPSIAFFVKYKTCSAGSLINRTIRSNVYDLVMSPIDVSKCSSIKLFRSP